MKTEMRPASSGYGRGSSASGSSQQGEPAAASSRPQQRVSSATRTGSGQTYFDIATTILCGAGDLDELFLNAARDGDYNKLEQMLVQRSDIIVDVDCKDKRTGNTALIWAAKKGHNKILQLLLRHGADPTLRNYEAQTAVEVATGGTKTMLLDSVSRATESSHRLLLQAAWQGNIEVIQRLLATKKLDINCQNAEGLTPLMLVARDVQLFERLAVQLNKHYNPVEVAQELMRARADVHARDNDGRSCLHYAALAKATVAEPLVETFIGGGSEPAQLDKRQYTPIHWASQMGNTNVVVALLDGGSEVNSRGFAGLTPLHVSAHNDHQRTAVTLLQHGADVTLTDDRGLTPVDLAKTRKMKTTLKEAWAEATQNNSPLELAPVRTTQSRESGSRLSLREESPTRKKGEVIFDGMLTHTLGAQRSSQPTRTATGRSSLSSTEKARRAERQMIQEIESGRYTPSLLHSRENTRLLGTVRNKPGPPILPHISKGSPSPSGPGCQSPESPPPGQRSSQGEELRRSLEDGRNMLAQRTNARRAPLPARGRLSKTTPISTSEKATEPGEENSGNNNGRTHRRTGSDPFSTRITDIASTLENIINRRGRSVSTGEAGGIPDLHLLTPAQHVSPLRAPLDRETTMCVNIPTTIPEGNSPGSSTIAFETDTTHEPRHSTVPSQMMSLPPTSNRILPPTPTFLTQRSYSNLDSALSKAILRDEDSPPSSKEPSPRSDDEIPDNKIRVGLANPMELLRSRSLLKEEFVLAESRPRDPFMASSGSDQTSSSSSISTASSSPRDSGTGRSTHRRSDPSLLTVTLRDKAIKGAGFRKSDLLVVQRSEKPPGGGASGSVVGKNSSEAAPGRDRNSPANSSSSAARDEASKVGRSQSLRMTQRPTLQQQGKTPSAASTASLKRSQSSSSVASEAAGKQTDGEASDAKTSQQQGSVKGAPFSGKGRMVIVLDSFNEFDNVVMASSANFTQNPPPVPPLPCSSSGSTQTSAKQSQGPSHDKPESAYVKESMVSSERGCADSGEQGCTDRRRVDSESRMSVSDVAISGINPLDSGAVKDAAASSAPGAAADVPAAAASRQATQKEPGSKATVSKPPVPNSQSGNSSNKSAGPKTVSSQPSGQSAMQAKSSAGTSTKPSITGSASSPASSKTPTNSAARVPQAAAQTQQTSSKGKTVAVTSANRNAKKEGMSPSSSAMPSSRSASTVVNAPVSQPPVSKTTPTVSSSSTAVRSGNLSSSLRSASSGEHSPVIRKSASTESLSSQRASGSGGQGKQVSAEGGRKQNVLGGSQRGLSTSARDVTARLSGVGSGSSRAGSSSSSGGPTVRSDGSSTKGPSSASSGVGKVAPSAAKDVAKVVPAASKQQPAQTTATTKPSPPPTAATSAAPSKPASTASASTSGAIAKVMQTLMKGAASPRSSAIRGQQEKKPVAASSSPRPPASVTGSSAGSGVTAKSTPSMSTGVVSAKSTPGMSTGVVSTKSTPSMSTGASSVQSSVGVKPTVVLSSGSSANRPVKAGQGGVSKPAGVSKSVPASPVNTPKPTLTQGPGAAASNAHTDQKPSADTRPGQTLGIANSAKSSALMKSPSDSVLDKKSNAGEGKDLSAGGKEPLVKITFGGMNPKPNAIISRYCDPAVLVSTPVIVNPYEHLSAYQTPRDKSPGEAVSASDFGYVVGKPERDAAVRGKPAAAGKGRQGKGAKRGRRPTSSSSRQASAGKRRSAKGGKDGKSGEGDDARPKSGKRVRSGRRRGRKSADKQADKEAEVLAKNASKSDVALISGIGWHVATACADASDVIAASEIHIDSSDSDISDAESIEDAETLMHQLDISRGTISLTSPRFREIKIQKEALDARKCIPAVTSDGFPPMNLDMTQREDLIALPVTERVLTSAGDGDCGYGDPPDDVEDINGDLHKELLLRKLTPIPEMPSFSGPSGSVAEAIARFDRSLKDNQLNDLLEGTPRNDDSPASKLPESSALAEGREKPTSVDSSPKGLVKSNSDRNASKPPRIEVSSVATSSKPGRSAPRRTQSLKEGGPSEKRDMVKKKERKFSETKKEQDEEINDAIEEILSATNTSMSSTLRSTSTLKSASNTLTEGDHQLLLKLKTQSKDSPFHATAQHQDQDDDDASTLVGENFGSSGEGLTSDTNPSLLKVMHAENFDLGAKVKAMIDAGADEDKIKAMIKADEDIQQLEAKQIVKVMNSFRHMQLHAGGSQNTREPLVRSESHRVSKVAAAALDRVPLVRPSSAGAARTKGRFHELKKSSAGGSAQQLAERNEGKRGDSVEAHTDFAAAVVDALAGDVAQDVLGGTGASETMCSRLSRRSSRSGSACTHDSQEEETIQWKKGNVLGKGAFGTVWCGLTSEGELIAVKQIELTTTDRRKAEHEYEKVQEEVELLKTLNHTNIVGYLGTSFEDNTVSIFMQFVPGGSIASILARFGALDEAVFRRYTRQILQGVEYLHDNDVIHRDIKGGNVMLMPNGIIKLIDFGCAKRLCINLSLSQSQILRSMKGTPYWMAPEVVNESGHGKKSDIWSIGCTVFEMATMKPPWAEMNPMAAIFAIGSDRTVPKLPSKFSPEAIAFVSKCLTRNQHQRSSASELLKDVFMAERPSKK